MPHPWNHSSKSLLQLVSNLKCGDQNWTKRSSRGLTSVWEHLTFPFFPHPTSPLALVPLYDKSQDHICFTNQSVSHLVLSLPKIDAQVHLVSLFLHTIQNSVWSMLPLLIASAKARCFTLPFICPPSVLPCLHALTTFKLFCPLSTMSPLSTFGSSTPLEILLHPHPFLSY